MSRPAPAPGPFRSFAEFYPYYLHEHRRWGNRILHFYGTGFGLLLTTLAVIYHRPLLVAVGIVGAYGMAWTGHFFIEKNRPATFRHPFYSFLGDLRMFFELLTQKQRF